MRVPDLSPASIIKIALLNPAIIRLRFGKVWIPAGAVGAIASIYVAAASERYCNRPGAAAGRVTAETR